MAKLRITPEPEAQFPTEFILNQVQEKSYHSKGVGK